MSENEFRKLVENLVRAEGSQEKAARRIGISAAFLSDYRRGRRGAGKKLAAFFGMEPVLTYEKLASKSKPHERMRNSYGDDPRYD